MKLLHIADLHLGKRVMEYSMLEDARAAMTQILNIAVSEAVSGVLIAGDVYDRPVPPVEAVKLFSELLTSLSAHGIPAFIIAGNHDSPERLGFCAELLEGSGVHVAPVCKGAPTTVTLREDGMTVAVHMVSFFRPATLRPYVEEELEGVADAMRAVLSRTDRSADKHILLAHAFVAGGVSSESEVNPVGTVELIPTEVFEGFDYVALGHLHGPQSVAPNVRYAGSPLKYSFSEVAHEKSVTVVEIHQESPVTVREIPIYPIHDMRELRGSFAALMAGDYSEDFIRAVVTDEEVSPDARIALRTLYPNLMRFAVENSRVCAEESVDPTESVDSRDPLSLFSEFYERQNGVAPDETRLAVMRELLSGEVSE